jgi:hypothetical protein
MVEINFADLVDGMILLKGLLDKQAYVARLWICFN